ncbi:MAG: hypothetical protein GY853_02205 [PVC group bacterium]|nr:hypothetical protein [PVC group bacterium]
MNKVIHQGISNKGIETIKDVYKNLKRNPLMRLAMKGKIKLSFENNGMIFSSDNPIDKSQIGMITQQYTNTGLVYGEDYEVVTK